MKDYNFVVDIGNTHIVMGIYFQNKLFQSWRLSSDKFKTEDEYFSSIKLLAEEYSIDFGDVNKSVISSVVPEITRVFTHLIQKFMKCSVKIVNAYTELGLKFPVQDPGFIGADLVVNAFSAKEKHKTNCIVCDFGTATTVQLIGKDGYFHGSIIAPGVITSAKNLFESTSLLPNIQLQSPETLLGTNTKDSLLSGIITGNSYMLDGFIKAIKGEYRHLGEIKTIATGGIAELICENCKEIDIIDKNLTLDGLNLICQKQEI
ncbi:MAG: type III pantothenate kinase [Candidatus Cloacimonetes bacterium]|nr:type III pantothenate kinase [Candidatus Cloacimonadota bacterium]